MDASTSLTKAPVRRRGVLFYCLWSLFLLGVLFNMGYRYFFTPIPPLSLPDAIEPWEVPRTKLHAIVMCKEDGHAIVELVLNLISQGVSYVWVVDNMSQRPVPLEAFELLKERGYVHFHRDGHRFVQKRAYRYVSQYARWSGADWIMPVDADEFPYATQVGSLEAYLKLLDPEVCSVASPFRLFGSDGRENQPNSMVHGFVGRANNTLIEAQDSAYKTISRMHCTLWMAIHHSAVIPRYKLRGYNALHGFRNDPSPILDGRSELFTPDLITNHYRSQSRRFFLDVKANRGNAINNGKVRNEGNFQRGDFNHTIDTRLRHKVQERFPSLYQPDMAYGSNLDYSSPWPLENIQAALDELDRHQVLVLMDASDATLPDALSHATRNAAILDPTFDCMVRVAPGHVQSVLNSKLLQFCVVSMFPDSSTTTTTSSQLLHSSAASFDHFVTTMISRYEDRYKGFVILYEGALLTYGMETAPMRRAAMTSSSDTTHPSDAWQPWTEGVERGRVSVIASSSRKTATRSR